MGKLEIEKGVKMPLKKKSNRPSLAADIRAVLIKMEVGDSVALPDKKHFNAFGNAKKFDKTVESMTFRCFFENPHWRIFRTK